MSTATMSKPVKFDFGETFDDIVGGDYASSQEKERTWTEAEVEAERAHAMQRGLEQGRAQALSGIEQKIAEQNTIVLKHIARIAKQVDAACEGMEDDARALALVVGRKMGSALLAEVRHREIEALVTEALSLLPGQPHVVIRVNEDLLDGFRLRFEAIAEESGYQGKLILLGEPDIEMADCQIEWADGGMRRDMAQLDGEIDRLVRRHLGQPAHGAPVDDAAKHDNPDEERT